MLLKFDKLKNVRDIGGIENREGRKIRSGLFVRSGYLWQLQPSDKDRLSEMVDMIVDLRTDQEVREKPDDEIKGAQYLHLPIFNEFKAGITREESTDEMTMEEVIYNPEAAKEHMCQTYRYFVDNDYALGQFARLIRLCIEPRDKALLYHCTAGKDRTGISTVILLEILGVDRKYIIEDYMRTNEYLMEDYETLTGYIKMQLGPSSNTQAVEESLWYFFGAQREFIKLYYDIIEKRYGSFGDFVKNGLGITGEECEALRARALI